VSDHGGLWLLHKGGEFLGSPNQCMQRPWGALMVAELCCDLGLQDVILEGYSLQVI
jgi:hypothetical protein